MSRFAQHELRLHADPTRVVVRPFHLAWQATGPDLERVQRLAREIIAQRKAEEEFERYLRQLRSEAYFDSRLAAPAAAS